MGLAFGWLGPLALIGWLALRPPIEPVIKTLDDYTDPADALETAVRLDSQGDWDASIELYRYVAERWPDQMPYAFACIREIHAKQGHAGLN
ncbi:hypothetical protein FHS27_006440 [Rhodopirellula rubra]|uniref:Tetratricopeptide repeat protein n=1 Tax=Aporhodopirellula rubra TaxID=980271 RepID=A0A7W5H8E2_9BACT|nr:hypothetical protein [Aporhodopirellula rubra]EMI46154.1 hypothetical protein RRSWK_01339 [Rhodopirellula sp. SWK7]MBB3210592.1 hypothetical protein [Aporhodopirellula rubra]